jgi:cation diffusion facilitator family transporter
VYEVGTSTGSTAVKADAAHHLSDAITSAAAFVGISLALVGSRVAGGSGWAAADDWAALGASGVIGFNGVSMLRASLHDLMDRMPEEDIVGPIRFAACAVPGVRAIEKLHVRRVGADYRVTLHVQTDGDITLDAAHVLSGRVKAAICHAAPRVSYVLVHMEPYVPR